LLRAEWLTARSPGLGQEIAVLLVSSIKTVERHRANVLQRLEMRDRTELTRYAIRTGIES
jgi:DNA-binding NarL/FixJ family response regulator